MKLYSKIGIPVMILLGGFLLMMGLLSLKTEPSKRTPELKPKIVETATVKLGPVATEITAYGRVASAQPVTLYAEVSGTLEAGDVPFQPAQSFSEGDLILKIDDRQAKLDLNSRKSDLMTALANVLPEIKVDFPQQYQVWQDYFNSCQFDTAIDSLPETDNPKIKLFLSRFNVYSLYFGVRDLEILLDKHYFRAPFDGSIVSAELRVGSTARNGTHLGEIINLEALEVAVPVAADDIQWIDRTRPVSFTSTEIAGRWTGKIVRIGSAIDSRTQTVDVFMNIDNNQSAPLLNGAFLEAHFLGRYVENGFAIPPRALYEDRFVYVIEDGALQRREVVILRREINQVILDGGVNTGDTLVTEIMQGVAPGMPARPKNLTDESRGQ